MTARIPPTSSVPGGETSTPPQSWIREETLRLRPIGRLETPFRTRADCPRHGRQPVPAPLCHAAVDRAFAPGLLGIEGFSHLILLYWLHDRAPDGELVLTPPFHDAPRGVFATRAPGRPNPIGVSVVSFEGMEPDGRLRVRYLDCIDGTPLLDIKPYLPNTDSESGASVGWLAPYTIPRTS